MEISTLGHSESGSGFQMGVVSTPVRSPAVVTRNVFKSVGNGKIPILQDFSMTVPKGCIYNLLGSSGCGKTTALACIAGIRRINSGQLFVLGMEAKEGIPGSRIGYMPQEFCLYEGFSIEETLCYFGALCVLGKCLIKFRMKFLSKLLGLPDVSRSVGSLSGGEKRRVSFAVAIIHEPELLLLDEPTVGVDPLLRESIWNHLVFLAGTKKTTIVLTTHYLNEGKSAKLIGVMRHGKLVAEECPQVLLNRYNTSSLEAVLVQLWKTTAETSINPFPFEIHPRSSENPPSILQIMKNSVRRIASVVHKNGVVMGRNFWLLMFIGLVPAMITLVTGAAFWQGPSGLRFGVVNGEMVNGRDCKLNEGTTSMKECPMENLSCVFINHLPTNIIILNWYETVEKARDAVKEGKIWGFLSFPTNYSTLFIDSVIGGVSADDDEESNKPRIKVEMDQTDKMVYQTILETLYNSLEQYGKDMATACGLDERQAQFPLQYKTPIFGDGSSAIVSYVTPGVALGWLAFIPMLTISISLIGEKKSGMMERHVAAGVKIWEILLGFIVTESAIFVWQSVLVYGTLRTFFGIGEGTSPGLALALFAMHGCSGLAFGLLMAGILNEEIQAALVTIAIFFPVAFLAGVFWPKEGLIPEIVQTLSSYLPFTRSVEAARSVMNRGWEFTHPEVWPGFATLGIYIIGYFVLAMWAHSKFKSK